MKGKKIILPILMFFIVSCLGNISIVHGEESAIILTVENPSAASRLGGDIEVRGFAVGKNQISKIEVFMDNTLVAPAAYGLQRTDVQASYPDYPNSLSSGFALKVNTRGYENGNHQIKIVATDINSTAAVTTVDIQLENQRTPIMGQTVASREQMIKYFQSVNISRDINYLNNFVTAVLEEAAVEGVRGDVAFAQMMKETNFLRFTGVVKEVQNNFAGIGATGGTEVGASFPDIRTGIRAVIQHLKAYASTESLRQAVVDPRFAYVKRGSAPYVEWLGINENPIRAGWAVDVNYGYDIVNRVNKITSISAEKGNAKIDSLTVPNDIYVDKTILGTAAASSVNKVLFKFYVIDRQTNEVIILQEFSEKDTFTWIPKKTGKFALVVQARDQFSTNEVDNSMLKEIEVKGAVIPKTIVIDPGHGGSDPGAVANGYREKDLNMRLAQKIADKLRAQGYNVIFTRDPSTDVYVSLEDRAKFANDMNADLFLSIHHDAASSTSAGGTSVFYSSYRLNIDDADIYVKYNGVNYKFLGEADGGFYIDYNGTKKYVSINESTAFDSTPSQEAKFSSNLAFKLAEAIASLGLNNRGTQDRNLFVTRRTNMVSVLIEAGFITNPDEVQKLADDGYQNSTAEKIAGVVGTFIKDNMTTYINKYAVNFISNGGPQIPSQQVLDSSKVIKPEDPTKGGYKFGGWYTDQYPFTKTFDFSQPLTNGNVTLYARWIPTESYITSYLQQTKDTKLFGIYNQAKAVIYESDLSEAKKSYYLGQLAQYDKVVFTSINKYFINRCIDIASNPNLTDFLALVNEIDTKLTNDIDKGYFKGQMDSWGRYRVYTPEVQASIDAIVQVWTLKTPESVNTAKAAIANVKQPGSVTWLNNSLNEAVQAMSK